MRNWKIAVAVTALGATFSVPLAIVAASGALSATAAGSVSVPFAGNQLDAIASKAAKKCETAADWVYQDVRGDLPKPTPSASPPSCPKPSKGPSPSASVTPSASPSTTASPTSSPSPTASSTIPPGSLPSSVLDLSDWKVTLPVDKNGNSGSSCTPLEVTQPALASFSDQWFQATPAGDGVVFKADVEGCSTSNSSYPRSELREMTNGGKTEASWSTTSGTNTMTLTEAITHLPTVKPQVVFEQVHGSSDDVGFGEATGNKDGTALLNWNHNGTSWGTLDAAYVLGTRFDTKIVASGGFIDVYYNGTLKIHHAVSSTSDYFKAGDYTQSNISKGDSAGAFGEVILYALTVTHS